MRAPKFLRNPSVKFSMRGLDLLGVAGVILACAAFVMDSDWWVAGFLAASCALICYVILSHKEVLGIWLLLATLAVICICLGLFYHSYAKNLADELAKNDTNLQPDNSPTPILPANCDPPKDAFIVIFGSNIAIGNEFPRTILRMGQDPMLVIDRGKTPQDIKISLLKIFDDRGDIVVSFRDNVFHAQPAWRRIRKDTSSLTVFDRKDEEVLRIRLLNEHTLVVTGIFRHEGVATIRADDEGIHVDGRSASGSCLFPSIRESDFSVGPGPSSTIGF